MSWIIDYFSEDVRLEIDALPVGIRASYTRLTELLEEFGLELRMPHSRAMGGGLFELLTTGREVTARVFCCMQVGWKIITLHSYILILKRRTKRRRESLSLLAAGNGRYQGHDWKCTEEIAPLDGGGMEAGPRIQCGLRRT